jgi:DNA-binding GntR family transcriptional regulator
MLRYSEFVLHGGALAGPRQLVSTSSNSRTPYELIRDAIFDGTYEPGAPLVELTLAEQIGVSRTPIREALTRLQQDGLVERGGRGLVVRERSPEEILDIYEAREALETAVVKSAAHRRTLLDGVRIENAMRACEAAAPSTPEMVETNDQFHRAIWQASHNDALIRLLEQLRMHLARYPGTTLAYPGRWQEALEEHRAITAAIIDGDADKAGELSQLHFKHAGDIRVKLWETELS